MTPLILGFALTIGALTGCGGGSSGASTNHVDGPHETVHLTFNLTQPEYADGDAGSDCAGSGDVSMFTAGAPVIVRDAGAPDTDYAGQLGNGYISRADTGRCSFEATVNVPLGPETYTVTVGESPDRYTATLSQKRLVGVAGSPLPSGDNPNVNTVAFVR